MIFNAICLTQSLLSPQLLPQSNPWDVSSGHNIIHSQKSPSHENYSARLAEEEDSMQSGDKRGCSNVRDKNVGASGVKSQQMLWRKFARLIS